MRELVIDQLNYCQEYNTRVLLKTTVFEYVQRVGMIYGSYVDFALVVQ